MRFIKGLKYICEWSLVVSYMVNLYKFMVSYYIYLHRSVKVNISTYPVGGICCSLCHKSIRY